MDTYFLPNRQILIESHKLIIKWGEKRHGKTEVYALIGQLNITDIYYYFDDGLMLTTAGLHSKHYMC